MKNKTIPFKNYLKELYFKIQYSFISFILLLIISFSYIKEIIYLYIKELIFKNIKFQYFIYTNIFDYIYIQIKYTFFNSLILTFFLLIFFFIFFLKSSIIKNIYIKLKKIILFLYSCNIIIYLYFYKTILPTIYFNLINLQILNKYQYIQIIPEFKIDLFLNFYIIINIIYFSLNIILILLIILLFFTKQIKAKKFSIKSKIKIYSLLSLFILLISPPEILLQLFYFCFITLIIEFNYFLYLILKYYNIKWS